MSVYGPSPIKPRLRRTKAELEDLDYALTEIVAEIEPATVRQVFYQAVVAGLVPKDESKGYKLVQRRLLKLRETGEVPTAGSRITSGSSTATAGTAAQRTTPASPRSIRGTACVRTACPYERRCSMRLEFASGDPLLPAPCLLCGKHFDAEGYSGSYRPEITPGIPASGFAPGLQEADGGPFVGFVCPQCFGDGANDLAKSLHQGARRLKTLATALDRSATREPSEGEAGSSRLKTSRPPGSLQTPWFGVYGERRGRRAVESRPLEGREEWTHSLRVLIADRVGLHARPSVLLCATLKASGLSARLAVFVDGTLFDLGSADKPRVMQLVRAAIGPQEEVEFLSAGEDAHRVLEVVREAICGKMGYADHKRVEEEQLPGILGSAKEARHFLQDIRRSG